MRELGGSGRVNNGEIGGPVSVSVASGKGGVQVLDPTDSALQAGANRRLTGSIQAYTMMERARQGT